MMIVEGIRAEDGIRQPDKLRCQALLADQPAHLYMIVGIIVRQRACAELDKGEQRCASHNDDQRFN
jgi:hypothetical protein